MQAKSFRKSLKFKIFLFIIVSFFLLNLYLPLCFRWRRFKEEKKKLLAKIEDLKEEISNLEKDLKALEKDPHLLEKLVREKLGFVKENELIVDIKE